MRIAVPKEIREGEKRVALVPDVINKLTRLGYEVVIESGAGVHAQASDDLYRAAGAKVESSDVIGSADRKSTNFPNSGADEITQKRCCNNIFPLSSDCR